MNSSPQPPVPVDGKGQAAGGEDQPARDVSHVASRAGHIPCCICLNLIPPTEYGTARCWVDPQGDTCAAHDLCLIRVGEREIGLV